MNARIDGLQNLLRPGAQDDVLGLGLVKRRDRLGQLAFARRAVERIASGLGELVDDGIEHGLAGPERILVAADADDFHAFRQLRARGCTGAAAARRLRDRRRRPGGPGPGLALPCLCGAGGLFGVKRFMPAGGNQLVRWTTRRVAIRRGSESRGVIPAWWLSPYEVQQISAWNCVSLRLRAEDLTRAEGKLQVRGPGRGRNAGASSFVWVTEHLLPGLAVYM